MENNNKKTLFCICFALEFWSLCLNAKEYKGVIAKNAKICKHHTLGQILYTIKYITMFKKQISLLLVLLSIYLFSFAAPPAASVECWGRFEISFKGPQTGNPFTDVWVTAEFEKNNQKYKVDGFYDGEGIFKLRFMPTETGEWSFSTKSNSKALNGKTGNFTCVKPSANNHGPVKVSGIYNFSYADGKQYYPFGTTIYAWTHQGEQLEEMTLNTLENAPFNKVRMCVFPKYYSYVQEEPRFYPYVQKGNDTTRDKKKVWDFTRFNPAFFEHLEKRIDDLNKLGIEADLIIFHPYDKGHWGFDSMGRAADLQYIKYLVSRLSSFKNVWWSMANEYDYIKTKPHEAWDVYTKAVVNQDPYRHLCSIHNGSIYYEHWKPEFTHVSIQNGSAVADFGRAVLLRDAYFKPVMYDEVCYEGNLPMRWGNLTGEEMVLAFWQGIIAGTYVTHGETYKNNGDTVFWAKGGRLIGSSPARIAFLKKIVEEGPGPLQLADVWKDNQTATANTNYYLVYFGKDVKTEWQFSLPKKNGPQAGAKYKVEIIDTWNMTIEPVPGIFEADAPDGYRVFDKEKKKIPLPAKPFLALRITTVSK